MNIIITEELYDRSRISSSGSCLVANWIRDYLGNRENLNICVLASRVDIGSLSIDTPDGCALSQLVVDFDTMGRQAFLNKYQDKPVTVPRKVYDFLREIKKVKDE